MNVDLLNRVAIGPAFELLPPCMRSPDAARVLAAICVQESALRYRRQVLRPGRRWWEWRGPSLGWPQFEPTGLRGVLTHPSSRAYARELAEVLGYKLPGGFMPLWLPPLHAALEHNDVLALGMARLLLWTLPHTLPQREVEGFDQYLSTWRPGAWFRGDSSQRAELRRRWTYSWRLAKEVFP